jgi:hypothetical protein
VLDLLVLGTFLRVADVPIQSDPFLAVFTATCMQHYYDKNKLRTLLSAEPDSTLSSQEAAYFLRGGAGSAWRIGYQDRRYVVSLRDDGICAVFAQQAAVESVRDGFTKLVSSAGPPFEARQVNIGPNTGSLRTLSFAWARPSDATQLQFTLTTSDEPTAQVKAMASMAVTQKPN